jgi:hypothetical protein
VCLVYFGVLRGRSSDRASLTANPVGCTLRGSSSGNHQPFVFLDLLQPPPMYAAWLSITAGLMPASSPTNEAAISARWFLSVEWPESVGKFKSRYLPRANRYFQR